MSNYGIRVEETTEWYTIYADAGDITYRVSIRIDALEDNPLVSLSTAFRMISDKFWDEHKKVINKNNDNEQLCLI